MVCVLDNNAKCFQDDSSRRKEWLCVMTRCGEPANPKRLRVAANGAQLFPLRSSQNDGDDRGESKQWHCERGLHL